MMIISCTSKTEKMESELRSFISSFEQKAIPLYRETALTSWNANISGTEDDYSKSEKASMAYESIFTDKEAFSTLTRIKESGAVKDTVLARQLELLYNSFLGGQIDTSLISERIRMETEITKKYSNFRANINGRQVSDNEIELILRNSTKQDELRQAWEGSKMIGPLVADDIIRLVKHRNTIAQKLGFSNYHEMSLKLSGQEPDEVTAILDELDMLTADAFAGLKTEIDTYLAKRNNINASDLKPWHYQNRYFQEAPEIYAVDFDRYYSTQDPVKLVTGYYESIGLDVTPILEKSDLYEKPGKNQHAFCIDIDRQGDVRTLNNIRADSYWMNTILHELGHGVYSYYNDRQLPFVLRDAAHTFTTEAIANLFGRFATDPQWMLQMGVINENESTAIAEESKKALRLQMLVFSRWVQVMYRFEKSMYENPDQDLNKLWWDLAAKYQLLENPGERNMPDWATKIHVALYPCYYHNYLLGEMLASQLYSYIMSNITENSSFHGDKNVGDYLRKNIFMPGAKYYWNDMIERATGEKLTARHYADQFINQ